MLDLDHATQYDAVAYTLAAADQREVGAMFDRIQIWSKPGPSAAEIENQRRRVFFLHFLNIF